MCLIKFLFIILSLRLCFSAYVDGLNIKGNQIFNSDGQVVKLRGTTKSGSEYACIQGWGIFDGPVTSQLVSAIKSWNINIVRIPLNEDCWLGINGVKPQYGGSNYQDAIRGWVDLLYQQGIASILDLHWAAPGTQQATSQLAMPNTDHSLTFWTQVANAYKNNSHVIFEAFNEPYPDNNAWNSTSAWTCWRDGGSCNDINFQVAGMQSIVSAIRSTGAKNIIILGGIQYSNSLVEWLQYKPVDPLNQLGAVWHSYSSNHCNNIACWGDYVRPVQASVPVIATEIGESDCAHGYIDTLMPFLDSIGAHYLAWAFNPFNCNSFPSLITNYDGTPSNYGVGFKNHLANNTFF